MITGTQVSTRPVRTALATTLVVAATMFAATLDSAANERRYFESVQGKWSGEGRIAAGPYKNTRFTCNFSGEVPNGVGMELNGVCRVGIFPQRMSAKVVKRGNRYSGRFTLGKGGDGLDVVSGRLRGKKLTLGIRHKKLRGTFLANLKSPNDLNLTIAVRVNETMIPFIGLSLKREGVAKKTSFVAD